MTYAICLKCGESKVGAFTPCVKCGFMPTSPAEQARSLLLSDHNLDKDALDAAAAGLKSGSPPQFDESAIEEMAREMEKLQKLTPPGALGCRIASIVLIAIPVVLVIIIVVMTIYRAMNQP